MHFLGSFFCSYRFVLCPLCMEHGREGGFSGMSVCLYVRMYVYE